MNIIQSYWSKPAMHNNQNFPNNRKFGGWSEYKYFIYSLCFSCLTIKRLYCKVGLYTDNRGYDLFIRKLALPYNDVSLTLNDLKDEGHQLWTLGKFKAFQSQEEPFIHIDNDIYLWRKLPDSQSDHFLIAQSNLLMPHIYTETLKEVVQNFQYLPEYLVTEPKSDTTIVNLGIVGGNDVDFFQEFCYLASTFLDRNRPRLQNVNMGYFNCILEEYLFTCLVKAKKREVLYLIDNQSKNALMRPMDRVLRFNMAPLTTKYIHLISKAKQNEYACEQLELRFEYEFPEYYQRVAAYLKEEGMDGSMNSPASRERMIRVKKALPVLYNSTEKELLNKKIHLIDKATIITNGTVSLSIRDPESGKEATYLLTGTDELLAWFQNPVSLNELLEELRMQNPDMQDTDYQEQRFKLMDIVTEKIFTEGLLEFVE